MYNLYQHYNVQLQKPQFAWLGGKEKKKTGGRGAELSHQ